MKATPTTRSITVLLACENGHRNRFTIEENLGTKEQPRGEYGEFASGESVTRVPRDSYAHTHGGCCFRAANDCLNSVDVFAD